MEESKALHRLLEVADLVGMVEEMMSPTSTDRLSPASWSGLRITLRNVRDMVQASHATLSSDMVNRSRAVIQAAAIPTQPAATTTLPQVEPAPRLIAEEKAVHSVRAENPLLSRTVGSSTDASRSNVSRRDLKASLEKIIER